MSVTRVVVVGASAGGVEALSRMVAHLPANLNAAVFAVVHFPQNATSVLPSILARSGPLPAEHVKECQRIEAGQIYVAPPGRHMILRGDHVHLVAGPRENGNRPAIDPLFRSAARHFGPNAVGVLLSGMLDDGTLGFAAIHRYKGITIVQDPEEALFGDMPRNAMDSVSIDFVLPIDQIGPMVAELASRPVEAWSSEQRRDQTEFTLSELQGLESLGRPSTFTCPECHGTLFEVREEGLPHYRCRMGHSFLAETLSCEQEGVLDAALWTALRAVKEHNSLLEEMLIRADRRGYGSSSKGLRLKLDEGERRIQLLTRALGLTMRPMESGQSAGDDSGKTDHLRLSFSDG